MFFIDVNIQISLIVVPTHFRIGAAVQPTENENVKEVSGRTAREVEGSIKMIGINQRAKQGER